MWSEKLKETQEKWMSNLLQNNELCDTQFVVGKEKKNMYGMRALLANISPVFKAQFYGSFKESLLSESIEYPTIEPNVFECILRVSCSLNPNINEHTAIPLIQASHMLQIPILQEECQHFLQNFITENNVLFVLNSAYCLNSLDKNLYLKCKSIILEHCDITLENDGFFTLHPDIVIDIISCDNFEAKEENIWNACLKWAQTIVQRSIVFKNDNANAKKILNIYDNDSDDHKIAEIEINEDDSSQSLFEDEKCESNGTTVAIVLKPVIPYIRYTLMSKEFFIENVCKYLSRNQSESVLIHLILETKTIFCESERTTYSSFDVIESNIELESAKKIPDLGKDALFSSQRISGDIKQWFVIDIKCIAFIKKIEIKNRYSDKDTLKNFKLQCSVNCDKYCKMNDSNMQSKNNDNYEYQWVDIAQFQSKKNNTWQSFNVNVHDKSRKSRFYRIILLDTYGGYTCLNHMKISIQHCK